MTATLFLVVAVAIASYVLILGGVSMTRRGP